MVPSFGTLVSQGVTRPNRRARSLAVLVTALLAVACDADSMGPGSRRQPSDVQLGHSTIQLDRGDTLRLASTGADAAAGVSADAARLQRRVTWTSSDPSIAVVSRSGLVLAQRAGEVTITATTSSGTASSNVKVRDKGKPVTIAPSLDTLHAVGHQLQLSVTVLNNGGKEVSDPVVTWKSVRPDIVGVSAAGLVTGLAVGEAAVIAESQGRADTARVVVIQSATPPTPAPAIVEVTPGSAQAKAGETLRLEASVKDGSGAVMSGASVVWSSSDPTIAVVDPNGVVTAKVPGTALVRATADDKSGSAAITVHANENVTDASWDRVLENVTLQGDVIVPDGERWLIGPNVRIAGNLVTRAGTIGMRPGSSLRFLNARPEEYVGGGMGYAPEFARDIGLWIGGQGVLDIRGTPTTGWNRTGVDPTWKPGDEYWIAPTAVGDFVPRRWFPGEPIPRVDPRVPAAEVMNVTRDIVIEGPGHIHIHSHKPQRIEYVQLRRMGVSNLAHGGAVLGRYALHIHHGGDGTRGTIIRGVAAIHSEGRVFVPHESNGITLIDNVSVNSFGEALWWDEGDASNDITVDRLAVSGVNMPRIVSGRTSREPAVLLPGGENLIIRNSAVSGAAGSATSHGYDWGRKNLNDPRILWTWHDNVAHNNRGIGIRTWWNHNHPHAVSNAVTYRNGWAGVQNGAYRSSTRFNNVLLVEDRWHQSSNSQPHEVDRQPGRIENLEVYQRVGPAIVTGKPRQPARDRMEFIGCTLQPGPGAPKVLVDGPGGPAEPEPTPFVILFRHCGLTPNDIEFLAPFSSGLEGTSIIIEHEDGRSWEITLDTEKHEKVVRQLR